jgi:hypothetical protein
MSLMSRIKPALFAALALAGVAAVSAAQAQTPPAKPAASNQRQCFLSRDVNGFNAPDDHTVYIRVGVNEIWRLDLMMDCLDLTFRQELGLESTPGDPWVCSPLDAQIIYRQTGIPQRCPVTALHKLTPAEVAALPKKDLP